MIVFEDHFRMADAETTRALELALSKGGDLAEVYSEYRIYSFINMEEDIIKETAESISLGLGVRVISGEKTGYGYTNDLSFDAIRKAALTAASIADSAKTVPPGASG